MKTIEIIGFKRENLTKSELDQLRMEGNVPGVLYGGSDSNKINIPFTAPAYLFRDVLYTKEACFVEIAIEGKKYKAICQEVQYHPVNEMILHVDLLALDESRTVKMDIPVALKGTSVGVTKGGRLVQKLFKLKVRALPKNMPQSIEIDVTDLDVAKSIRVNSIQTNNFEILNAGPIPIVSVALTRALRAAEQGK